MNDQVTAGSFEAIDRLMRRNGTVARARRSATRPWRVTQASRRRELRELQVRLAAQNARPAA